jgi:hypothetical protein
VPKFDAKLADLGIDGRFELPAFSLLGADGQRLVEVLYSELTSFGIELSNVTYSQVGSLADRNVYFALPALNAGVKVAVGRMEVGFNDLTKVDLDVVNRVAQAAYGSLDKAAINAKIRTYTATLNTHGLVEGTPSRNFIKPFLARVPSGLGPLTSSGAVFYFGAHGSLTQSALVVDSSVVVRDGVYIRVIFTLDGQRVQLRELTSVGNETIKQAFAALDLQLTTQ